MCCSCKSICTHKRFCTIILFMRGWMSEWGRELGCFNERKHNSVTTDERDDKCHLARHPRLSKALACHPGWRLSPTLLFDGLPVCHALILSLVLHLSHYLQLNQDHKHGILLNFTSLGLPLWEVIKHPLCFLFTFLLVCILTLITLFKIQKYVLFPFSYCTR